MENSKANESAAEPPLDCRVGQRIERYLRQLAPHQNEREGPQLMREALTGLRELARYAQHQQARIDALMLEYCPDEMTPEQIAEWERHQKAVHVTPAIDEACRHDWENGEDGNPERCSKCGLSFMRYVHGCCP